MSFPAPLRLLATLSLAATCSVCFAQDQLVEEQPVAGEEAVVETPAETDDPLGLGTVDADNPGQEQLDQAMDLKLTAQDLKDLTQVIDLLDEAIERGLDADNTDFAEQLLAGALMQRGEALGQLVLRQPLTNPQADPGRALQWLDIRARALTDLLRVVSLDDANFDGWVLIGRLQSLPRGDKSEARRAFSSAIRLAEQAAEDPQGDPIDENILAQAYALRGAAQKDEELRIADLTQAIEIDPSKAEYLLLRAQAHRMAERSEECLSDIDLAIEIAPENAKAHELRALALSMQDRNEEAIEAFNRASELAPQSLDPYRYRGELYSQLGRMAEAIDQYDQALEVSPNNLVLLLMRAQLLIADEQSDRALEDLDKILASRPTQPQALLMKSRALTELDRIEEAVALLEGMIANNPGRAELLLQLALIYVDQQMAPEAIDALDQVLQIDEESELALRLRGDMHLYAGQHADAIADFQSVLELNPDDAGVLNNYAWTLATSPFGKIRDGEKAVELASQAVEITQRKEPHILSTLGAAYAEAGQFEEAVANAEEAVAKATELGTSDNYDGQLEAELNCYRSGQPWRELQKLDLAGPASENAEKLEELEPLDSLEDLGSLPIPEDEEDSPVLPDVPQTPIDREESTDEAPRSFDF